MLMAIFTPYILILKMIKVYEFIRQTGLERIFCNRNIKDLYDFVFGIEVGLDSNARKNRSGKAMENHLSGLFFQAQLNFLKNK